MKPFKKFFSLMLTTSLLTACSIGPNYRRPNLEVPGTWSAAQEGGLSFQAEPVSAWWKVFKDPTLNSLIERAVQANLDLKIAQARVREARAFRSGTVADFLPILNASGELKRTHPSSNNQPNTIPSSGSKVVTPTYNLYEAGFDASWEIDIFGGRRRSFQAANAELAASEENARDTLVILLAEVARNYVEVRGFQRRLAIAENNLKLQQEAVNITQTRFDSGLTNVLDVAQATALLATTQSQVPAFEQALRTATHRLSVLLGRPPGALFGELTAEKPIPKPPPLVPAGLPADLLRRRPDVRKAEHELMAATARIGIAESDLFPKFFLTGIAQLQSVSASDWFSGGSRFWSAGPTVQWQIFNVSHIQANIRVENARQDQALANFEKTVLTSMEDAENALVAYAKEQQRYEYLKKSVDANRQALNISNDLYGKGLTNFLNVLESQRSLYTAEDQLVQSERTISANIIALYKALGGGWETFTGEKS